jgi:hypothetical protein
LYDVSPTPEADKLGCKMCADELGDGLIDCKRFHTTKCWFPRFTMVCRGSILRISFMCFFTSWSNLAAYLHPQVWGKYLIGSWVLHVV